jgi:hypothetical protein
MQIFYMAAFLQIKNTNFKRNYTGASKAIVQQFASGYKNE